MSVNFVLKLQVAFESYMILLRIRNPKTNIVIKVRATEQIFVLSSVN